MSNDEKALVPIFQEMGVITALRNKILEEVPNFPELSPEDQRTYVEMYVEGEKATTEGVQTRFPILRLMHAGSCHFKFPDNEVKQEFEGVILDQYPTKAWWAKGQDEGGAAGPPDCASVDGEKPYVQRPQHPTCAGCPKNKFGSGKGRGKACRDQRMLVLRVDGHVLPMRLQLSATNLKPLDIYLTNLANRSRRVNMAVTRFRAVEARNQAGVKYTGLDLSLVRMLEPKEAFELHRDVSAFRAMFRTSRVEFDGEGSAGPSTEELERQAAHAKKAQEVM